MFIILNVVVLVIQGAPALDTPRQDDGYFQSWEDVVLLVLFGIFTWVAVPSTHPSALTLVWRCSLVWLSLDC